MRHEPLGRSGLSVSVIGLGTNQFGRKLDLQGSRAVIDAALDSGINHLDTADVYGGNDSERFIAEALEGRRDRAVIATKFGMGSDAGPDEAPGSRAYLRRALDGSLGRLRTDWVDLYYYHRPDGTTPLAETLGALAELADEGKIRTFGVSNFGAAQLDEAAAFGDDRLVAVQNRLSLLMPDADVLAAAGRLGVGYVPYQPLAGGLLSGKYRPGEPPPPGARLESRPEARTPEAIERVEAFSRFAAERGHTVLELAQAALASQPAVLSVISGATSGDQVRANARAADWELNQADLEALARI